MSYAAVLAEFEARPNQDLVVLTSLTVHDSDGRVWYGSGSLGYSKQPSGLNRAQTVDLLLFTGNNQDTMRMLNNESFDTATGQRFLVGQGEDWSMAISLTRRTGPRPGNRPSAKPTPTLSITATGHEAGAFTAELQEVGDLLYGVGPGPLSPGARSVYVFTFGALQFRVS
jgi:hypothetical protein